MCDDPFKFHAANATENGPLLKPSGCFLHWKKVDDNQFSTLINKLLVQRIYTFLYGSAERCLQAVTDLNPAIRAKSEQLVSTYIYPLESTYFLEGVLIY